MQDTLMKEAFKKYPEFVLCDATHNTNNIKMSFYLFMVVDGNGESECVAAFLVSNEQEPLIRKIIKTFKD